MLVTTKHEMSPGAAPWPAALIVWGPGSASTPHAHHCVQLILALAGSLRFRGSLRATWARCGAVIIPPDALHEVQALETPVLIAFIDRESNLAGTLLKGERLKPVPNPVVARWRRALGDPSALEPRRVEQWLRSEIFREPTTKPLHPSVRRVVRLLRDHPLDPRSTTLPKLAKLAGLSSSRFLHVFTESVGIPLRPYMLWLRVQRAVRALASGSSVTEAAYVAGFADAPHLNRTFRRMLGATPRELISRSAATHGVRVDSPDS
jgi:AraC-like DNA-binding protein